jgi:hypothetical protein
MSGPFNRTVVSSDAFGLQPIGRNTNLNGIYVGFVKNANDAQKLGRLQVWIPEFGSKQEDDSGWFTVTYCPPFGGATNLYDNTNGTSWTDTQNSYGMWFVPPDIDNEVVCGFINGDPGRGIWWACLYNQYMNHMVPGLPGNQTTVGLPVAEYNKLDDTVDPVNAKRPIYSPLAQQLILQGLQEDETRGISSSGARRSDPVNQVSGILTPGGSQLVFDDNGSNSFIRIRTQQGAQLVINDTVGSIYMNSRDGLNWVELSADGFIDIYSQNDVNIRTQGDLNMQADGNMYFDAGGSIYMKARGENRHYNPTIFTEPTDAVNNIIGKQSYSYQGNYQIGNVELTTNTVIPPIVPKQNYPSSVDASGNTQPSNSNVTADTTTIKMDPTNTISVGDGIAVGIANNYGCKSLATAGIGIAAINKDVSSHAPITSPYVVLSAGSNDDYTVITTATPYQTLRSYISKDSQVIWVLPSNNRLAAGFIQQIATQNQDIVVDMFKNPNIPLDSTQVFPKNYQDVVNSITRSPVVPGSINPAASSNSTSTSSTAGTFTGTVALFNGQYIQFKQDMSPQYNGPIFLVQGVGASIKLVDTGISDDTGQIKIDAAQDVHVVAHNNIYQTAINEAHRLSGSNTFETAVGSYQRLSGGSIADQAVGGFGLRAGQDMLMSAAHIQHNGPLAPNAKQAIQAQEPLDNQLQDIEFDSVSQTTTTRATIVTRMPTHEPYVEHLHAGTATYTPVTGRGASVAVSAPKNLAPLAIITGPHLAWGAKVNNYANGGAIFRGKVWDMANKLGLPPADATAPTYSGADWLMAIMHFESAGTFSPRVKCGVSSATGLIQFMAKTAIALGTTTSALASMTPETQLDWVYKYFSNYQGKCHSLTDLYCVVLWPAAVGKSENYIVWTRGSDQYKSNHGFDITGRGSVLKSDITRVISKQLTDGIRVGNIWQGK